MSYDENRVSDQIDGGLHEKKQFIVSKRISLTWKIIALFGIGYMLTDLFRYVC